MQVLSVSSKSHLDIFQPAEQHNFTVLLLCTLCCHKIVPRLFSLGKDENVRTKVFYLWLLLIKAWGYLGPLHSPSPNEARTEITVCSCFLKINRLWMLQQQCTRNRQKSGQLSETQATFSELLMDASEHFQLEFLVLKFNDKIYHQR